ncbi:hypothetical protein QQ008_20910 [Fulvivirgaceae bacterium BMA10]|uniref:Outer membrane protein beta-barrel domain-containing protein n=1 Tax=Splendidivirga corallicola TaxID=3051826 RepID=A0ABT8KWQ7_9BACT|nr:hypothetical protein [Fulvivirgaceae bacterium BMA10]
MKKLIFQTALLCLCLIFFGNNVKAQFNPFANDQKMLTAGIGFSSWGTPIFGRLVFPVADYITVGGSLSYQSNSERFLGGKWKHTIVGIGARGNYHFNELLGVSDEWDFYAGATLGYYVWNTKAQSGFLDDDIYTGSGSGGLGLGIQIGGRYFFNDKFAVNLEYGGGSVLSSGTLGLTIML